MIHIPDEYKLLSFEGHCSPQLIKVRTLLLNVPTSIHRGHHKVVSNLHVSSPLLNKTFSITTTRLHGTAMGSPVSFLSRRNRFADIDGINIGKIVRFAHKPIRTL